MTEPNLTDLIRHINTVTGDAPLDYEHIVRTLEALLTQETDEVLRIEVNRVIAAVYGARGMWDHAHTHARDAYNLARSISPLNVDLLLKTLHTYLAILPHTNWRHDTASVAREALNTILPVASLQQKLQLLEMYATSRSSLLSPPV